MASKKIQIRICDQAFVSMYIRIRTELNGGAWCPEALISQDVYEWLEIDFRQMTVVTGVETQGRFGNGEVGMVLYRE